MGYEDLKRECFNARVLGSPSAVVNRRYLAAVLRIADILEFDPERTPESLFRHRDISTPSVIYSWKDHSISMRIEDHERQKLSLAKSVDNVTAALASAGVLANDRPP